MVYTSGELNLLTLKPLQSMVLSGTGRFFFPIWIPRQENFDQRNNIVAGV